MKEAVDKKFPKLAAWKNTEKAKTILVLEQNDIQLTNPYRRRHLPAPCAGKGG
jgi:hypothetical protein